MRFEIPIGGLTESPPPNHSLEPVDYKFIKLKGRTQFRLRFGKDDNDDLSADYLEFYSGNDIWPGNRPLLVVEYYVP